MDKRYKKPELQLPIHNATLFTWDKNKGVGTSDASNFIGKSMFSLMYNDACDVGCYIYSKRTGAYKPFILLCTQVDETEREILGWEFESMDDGGKFTVKIFNDLVNSQPRTG